MEWKFSVARARLSEVVRRALEEGPQRITRRGKSVVIISASVFDELNNKSRKKNFLEFLLSAPSFDSVDLERD